MEHDFTPEDAAPWPEKAVRTVDPEVQDAPVPAQLAEPAASMGPRSELLIGALVVLLTAGGTLALLVARENPSAAVLSANTGGTSAAAAKRTARAAAWTETAPRWTANPSAWLGRSKGVAYEVSAAETVGVWLRTVRPALVVRCAGTRSDVFVFTDSAAMIEANTEDHTVSYAFDDESPTTTRWPDGAEHNALFAPDGAAFSRRLQSARTFTFRFTPHNAQPVTMRFNTAGLDELLKPAARHCAR